MRTTKSNLTHMFEHAVRCATAAGIDTKGWALQMGSGTNGASYELVSRMMRERLGGTMTEAYATLNNWARAWQLVAAEKNRGK